MIIQPFGQDKILIGKWLPDNRFLIFELQLIMDLEQSFSTIKKFDKGWYFENSTLFILTNEGMKAYRRLIKTNQVKKVVKKMT